MGEIKAEQIDLIYLVSKLDTEHNFMPKMTMTAKTTLILGLLALAFTLPLFCDAELYTGPTYVIGTVSIYLHLLIIK